MSFSFVDHILEIEPDGRARGAFTLCPSWGEVQPWLVAEAIGQLAAWVAIKDSDFRRRPVAAIAGAVRAWPRSSRSGRIELEVEVEWREENTILYDGSAHLDGHKVGELKRCVGPMLPMEQFDDPAAVRRKFENLRSGSAEPQDISDPSRLLTATRIESSDSQVLRARLDVPRSAPFFADHFPRRPVFPATLLMGIQARLAVDLVSEATGTQARLACARHVKVRSFTPPGTVLDLEARLHAMEGPHASVAVRANAGERSVATARIEVDATATS
jgi:3-hydroxymyristoyl/3-hydroxydecanoyl-(acyl carrier protein) dehydratase